ncbi:MAG: amidohydrolase family protein [Planctomycetes bacterium]|nr:amidohydrolase family protein [Planctomycetota bacterium]
MAKAKTEKKHSIIDAHNHPDWHGHGFDKFIRNMDDCGIAKTWLLSFEGPVDESNPINFPVHASKTLGTLTAPTSFARCVAFKERAPERFVLGYCPDLRRPDAIDYLDAAIQVYGVKVCGELKLRMIYDNPDALRFYRFCGEKNLPVTMHFQYPMELGVKYPRPDYWYGGDLEVLERILQKCPGTIFIGHAQGFWAHLSQDHQFKTTNYPTGKVTPGGLVPEYLRKYPNLHADLSAGSAITALKRDPEFTKDFLLEFQNRLLYARDCFTNSLQEFLNSLALPVEVLNKIYFQNALRLVPED